MPQFETKRKDYDEGQLRHWLLGEGRLNQEETDAAIDIIDAGTEDTDWRALRISTFDHRPEAFAFLCAWNRQRNNAGVMTHMPRDVARIIHQKVANVTGIELISIQYFFRQTNERPWADIYPT